MAAPTPSSARYASIVIDYDTGTVLHEDHADDRNYPASLTKMMTLYLLFEALDRGTVKLDDKLPVSKRAQGMPPSKLWLKAGDTITVENAILALTTQSANDVAVVIAEALGGTEVHFAQLMTEKAHELGMSRTSYRNASGLPNRHQVSTARDIATLSKALLRDFPQYYDVFSAKAFRYHGNTYKNHNHLLTKYDGTDGIKTGYIRASGFNLAASVVRDGRRLIAVVFGGRTSRSRDRHMMSLLDRGFIKAAGLPRFSPDPSPPKPRTLLAAAHAADDAVANDNSSDDEETADDGASDDGSVLGGLIRPAQAASVSGPYGVQVGAFFDYDSALALAKKASARLPKLLPAEQVVVTSLPVGDKTLYRARILGLASAEAKKACRELQRRSIDCLIIATDG
ncbi:D-alanyl-D-alanine carboxypeptidase family protein [Tistlia consotensis]|nr:D-alanyl-D-alanine carboxypeptidase family protein [Tistlia consotensis]